MEKSTSTTLGDELKPAMRYSVNDKRQNKQSDLSLLISVSPEARDEDPVVATWSDGDAQEVTGLTLGMVRAWTAPHARKIIFEGCTLSQNTASLLRKMRQRDERRQWQGAHGHL